MATRTRVDLERLCRDLFASFDRKDVAAMQAMMDESVRGVDEISRAWLRGRSALRGYFDRLEELGLTDVSSTLSDINTETWTDTGLATFMVDQTYTIGGEVQHVTVPTTVVFRRRDDDWPIVLVHAVGLTAED
jgi:ketosteroid isomerase-like protein